MGRVSLWSAALSSAIVSSAIVGGSLEREILSLIVSVVLIIFLVRFRVDLGVSMLAGAATLALVVGRTPLWTLAELGRAAIDPDTLLLLARIITIMALGALAGKLGYLARFASGLRALIADNRVVVALIPAFGGLLPMPGGTMLTAPMVESAVTTGSATPEQKLFISYWFRHVWEYVWPVYPGVVVGASLIGREVSDLFAANWSATVTAIAAGWLFVLRRVNAGRNERVKGRANGGWKDIAHGVWPFGIVIAGVLVLKFELVFVILVVIAALVVIERPAGMDVWKAFRRGTEFQIVTLIVGVGAYKHLLDAAEIVAAVPSFLLSMNLPQVAVIAAVPLIVGLITGVTLAYIAVCFPLLIPLMGVPINMELVMLAFVSGFVGCLLSPVHLCLVLTREYFHASWGGIYKLLLPSCAAIMVVATLIVLL